MESTNDRFWSKVDRRGDDDCWNWTANSHQRGYGVFWFEGRNVRAHRLALEWHSGPPPFPDAMALHSCDNPSCCNPTHLRWGSAKDNKDDQILRKGPLHGEASPSAVIDSEIVSSIYRMRLNGLTASEISDRLGLPKTLVMNVYTGRSWSHRLGVDGNPTLKELRASKPKRKRKAPNRVLTDSMVDHILKSRMMGKTTEEISEELGVPKGTVSPVFCGLAFTHRLGVDGNPTFDELRSSRSAHHTTKLTEDDIIEIRHLISQGYIGADIAKKYGVSRATISHIKTGKR